MYCSSSIRKQPAPAPLSRETGSSAAASVQYLCRLLRSYGVCQLTPEILRQAKFDQPQALQPLLCALHDLALIDLADFPPNCAENLQWLKQQLRQENTQPPLDTLPPQGHLLLLHSLSSWGCPPNLVSKLALPVLSSRAALLALGWLIVHSELFDRALQQLQISVQLLPLLPPYPEDVALTLEAQQHYTTAAAAARQHQQHIQQVLQQQQHHHHHHHRHQQQGTPTAGASSSRGKGSCWSAVQTAAHHVLKTYRAAHLRLQQLTCLVEAREKLLHAVKQAQQQQQQPVASRHQRPVHPVPSSSSPGGSSRASRAQDGRSETTSSHNGRHPKELTAFELHLAAHPEQLQRHKVALCQAISLLQQQEDCRLHAQTFFAWVSSAITAPSQQQQPQQKQQHEPPAVCHGRGPHCVVTAGQGQQRDHQPPAPHLLRTASQQDLIALAQSLPPADSQLATTLLQRLLKQLKQAKAAAGCLPGQGAVGCSTAVQAPLYSLPAPTSTATSPAALAGQGHECLSGAHTPTAGDHSPAVSPLTAVDLKQHAQAAAVALLQAGAVLDADMEELREMPADVISELQSLRMQRSAAQGEELSQLEALMDSMQWGATHRRHADAMQGPPPQQQQQRQVYRGLSQCAAVCTRQEEPNPSAGQEHAAVVDAASAAVGLSTWALHVAKQLAKTRASNKQQLAAAAELLLHAGEAAQEGQLVLYQT